MSKAIDWLFELFEPDDYEGYDEEEIGYAGGLCMPEVCIALRGAMQTVYRRNSLRISCEEFQRSEQSGFK